MLQMKYALAFLLGMITCYYIAPPTPTVEVDNLTKQQIAFEVVELLEHALEELPGECREARWLLKERDDVIGRAHSEAETILAESRARIAQMVQKTEMVRIAEQRARQIVEESEATARRRQHEVDDYCDQKLAQFDAALENIHQTVNGARGKLHLAQPDSSSTQASTGASAIEQTEEIVSTFFDQDES